VSIKESVALSVVTPYNATEPFGEDGDRSQLLSENCVGRLEPLIEEAEDYVAGARAQKEFSFEDMDQPSDQGQAATA